LWESVHRVEKGGNYVLVEMEWRPPQSERGPCRADADPACVDQSGRTRSPRITRRAASRKSSRTARCLHLLLLGNRDDCGRAPRGGPAPGRCGDPRPSCDSLLPSRTEVIWTSLTRTRTLPPEKNDDGCPDADFPDAALNPGCSFVRIAGRADGDHVRGKRRHGRRVERRSTGPPSRAVIRHPPLARNRSPAWCWHNFPPCTSRRCRC